MANGLHTGLPGGSVHLGDPPSVGNEIMYLSSRCEARNNRWLWTTITREGDNYYSV